MSDLLTRTLQAAGVDGIRFPVTEMEVDGENAFTEFEQFGRDGAELVDAGRKAERGTFTAVMLNGLAGWPDLYPGRFHELYRRLRRGGDLSLAHPLLGTFTVKVKTRKPRIVSDVRSGGYIDFAWVEQRASSVGVVALDLPPTDVVADMVFTAEEADAALGAAGVPSSLGALATTARTGLDADLAPVGEIQGALGSLDRGIATALRQLSLVALTSTTRSLVHAARAAACRARGSLARVKTQVSDPLGLGRRVTTERVMTCAELSARVYGTPFKASILRAVNGFASDTVPAGTTVTIP